MFKIGTFYKCFEFPKYQELEDGLRDHCIKRHIKGTIILTPEGINATISSNKDNIRLIGIVGGLPSRDNRTIEMRKLINYGQRNFRKYNLFNKNDVLDEVDIWEGKKSKLNILTLSLIHI